MWINTWRKMKMKNKENEEEIETLCEELSKK